MDPDFSTAVKVYSAHTSCGLIMLQSATSHYFHRPVGTERDTG